MHSAIVDDVVGVDDGLVWSTVPGESLDGRAIEVDLVVNDKERIVGVHHVVVDADTIQVLLQQTLEEHVLLFQCGLLLVDSKPIKENLVESFVELIEKLELVILLLLEAFDPFNGDLREAFLGTSGGIRVTLIERQYLLLLSLELAAEFGSLEDLFSKPLILGKLIHAHLGVKSEIAEAALLILAELDHLLLEIVVVLHDHLLLLPQFVVALMALTLILLDLEGPVGDLFFQTVDTTLEGVDLL